MKFICDVHISYSLVNFLKNRGNDAIHVNSILDSWNTSDEDICRFADEIDAIVITKDSDFRNSYFLKNSPKKLVRILLGNISNKELIKIFEKNLDQWLIKFKPSTFLLPI
ncbi:MAG: DUF5615 family PIN-like protein [Bacteroidales bacterium]|nr:DUF5615 family PIN-like protein [Bacteroidales bacterium]